MPLLTSERIEPHTVWTHAGIRVMVTDSIAFGSPEHAGHVLVTGSHGGASAGEYTAGFGLAAVACNDAGVGKNDAGVSGLKALDAHGIVGVAVAHTSARIGDGDDVWDNGVVSFANDTATTAGIRCGHPLKQEIIELVRRWAAC